jgi:diguanylate cyclase (GGDEF)-like protein/PAS domain S-box-containing protein
MDEKNFYQDVLKNLYDGLYFVDKNRRITFWNDAAARITGFTAEEVLGRSCQDNILVHVDEDGNNVCCDVCPLLDTMKTGSAKESQLYLHHKDGHRVPVSVRTTPLQDDEGNVIGGIELFSGNQAKANLDQELKHLKRLALLDELTQLANRRHLETHLNATEARFKRDHIPYGLLFVDIDHFKDFNDTYGHKAGDAALQTVARTLSGAVRPFDVIGRWGGEEFLGIFPNVTDETILMIANRLSMLVRKSCIYYEDQKLTATCSIGATVVKDGESYSEVLERADHLMYRSKLNGRDRVTLG